MLTKMLTKKKISAALMALSFIGLTLGSLTETAFAKEMVLSLDDCLKIAEEYHPNLEGSAAKIAIEQARLSQTAVADRLTMDGSASAQRIGYADGDNASYSAGVSGSLKIFDSNSNKYSIESQRFTLLATEETAVRTKTQVIYDVKTAYTNLLLQMEIEGQRQRSVDAYKRHLEQARGFYEVGSKPWYDVTKAEVDLGNAQLALVEANGNVENAKKQLLNAMGVSTNDEFNVLPVSFEVPADIENTAESLSLENRADYKAAQLNVLASTSTMKSDARSVSPSISLTGGYSQSGDDFYGLDKGWNIGVRLSVPIIDGGSNKARLGIDEGQIRSQEAARVKLEQDILLEVRKSLTNLNIATESIRIADITLASAEENYKIARGRYEMGVGTPLEVTDALLSLTDANLSKYRAKYDQQAALISLEMVTGVDLNLH